MGRPGRRYAQTGPLRPAQGEPRASYVSAGIRQRRGQSSTVPIWDGGPLRACVDRKGATGRFLPLKLPRVLVRRKLRNETAPAPKLAHNWQLDVPGLGQRLLIVTRHNIVSLSECATITQTIKPVLSHSPRPIFELPVKHFVTGPVSRQSGPRWRDHDGSGPAGGELWAGPIKTCIACPRETRSAYTARGWALRVIGSCETRSGRAEPDHLTNQHVKFSRRSRPAPRLERPRGLGSANVDACQQWLAANPPAAASPL